MAIIDSISLARLDQALAYNPETGALTWKVGRGNSSKAGDVAGAIHPTGYRVVEVDGRGYQAHRVAYCLANGSPFPDGFEVDHRDGDRSNNALANLRLASTGENAQNRKRRSDNSSGFVGVSLHRPSGKWWAQICVKGKRRSLGLHETPDAAHRAYLDAKRDVHAFQPVPRG